MKEEHAHYWRVAEFDDLELLHATFITHSFARHIHEGFAIGMVERGAETFYYRRATHIAGVGSVVAVNPGEIHTGQAFTEEGWTYRMFYPSVTLLRMIAAEITGKPWNIPFIRDSVIRDPALAVLFQRLHIALESKSTASRIERETLLRKAFGTLIARYAIDRPLPAVFRRAPKPIQAAREYLNLHYAEDVSLQTLADLVGFSPYHFLRVFRAETGLPPHSYLTHVRIERAKIMLKIGQPISETAMTTGFTDQSHFTHAFKRIVGVTPGQYRLQT